MMIPIDLPARGLAATLCVSGGLQCPMIDLDQVRDVLDRVAADPMTPIRLTSDARSIRHFKDLQPASSPQSDPALVVARKRDLAVLQRLGLYPGDTRPAHYLYARLCEVLPKIGELCGGRPGGGPWEGCPHAMSGTYEGVRERGWQSLVWYPEESTMQRARESSVQNIDVAETLAIRPHHLMCMTCWYGDTGGGEPRPNDTLFELRRRMAREPRIPVMLVEGCCMACDCCDGFHPESGGCTHYGGVIRDYKKDLGVFERLGCMPGDTFPADELLRLLFERIPSTRDICAYGDGVVRSHEWEICGAPEGREGYVRGRKAGLGIV